MQTHHQSLINRQTVIMNHHANSILLNNTFVFWCWKLRSTSSLSLDEQKISSEVRSLAQFLPNILTGLRATTSKVATPCTLYYGGFVFLFDLLLLLFRFYVQYSDICIGSSEKRVVGCQDICDECLFFEFFVFSFAPSMT